MSRVAIAIESSLKYWKRFKNRNYDLEKLDYNFNMNYSICMSAANINAKAIIAYTETGDTPRTVSSFGPECPIFAITQNETTYRQLGLCWSIIPKLFNEQETIDKLLHVGINKLREENLYEDCSSVLEEINIQVYKNILDEYNELLKNIKDINSNDEIASLVDKDFKMSGIILDDKNIINAMDCNYDSGMSNILPIKSGNSKNTATNNMLSLEQFNELQDELKTIINSVSAQLASGDISVHPVLFKNKNTVKMLGCEYCPYMDSCHFETKCGSKFNLITTDTTNPKEGENNA